MQIISPMKKILSKMLAGPHFDAGRQPAAIPIRHMKFDFESHRLDHRFYMNAELASAYFASLSIFLTYGEGWVFDYGFSRLPQLMKLSLMAGIEHFTAVLAEYIMKHEQVFFTSQDEKQRAI